MFQDKTRIFRVKGAGFPRLVKELFFDVKCAYSPSWTVELVVPESHISLPDEINERYIAMRNHNRGDDSVWYIVLKKDGATKWFPINRERDTSLSIRHMYHPQFWVYTVAITTM
jgi:hypothetical protein